MMEKILELGRGTVLAKIDITTDVAEVPVHPQDTVLLGMGWEEFICVDQALLFGLRSAPLHSSCRKGVSYM